MCIWFLIAIISKFILHSLLVTSKVVVRISNLEGNRSTEKGRYLKFKLNFYPPIKAYSCNSNCSSLNLFWGLPETCFLAYFIPRCSIPVFLKVSWKWDFSWHRRRNMIVCILVMGFGQSLKMVTFCHMNLKNWYL